MGGRAPRRPSGRCDTARPGADRRWRPRRGPRLHGHRGLVADILDHHRDLVQAGQLGGLEPGTYVELTVRDSGIGMDAAKLEHLFEHPGPAADADTFEYKRPFLGLVITNQLVGIMGGRIELSSNLGKGTIVTVNLPLKKV